MAKVTSRKTFTIEVNEDELEDLIAHLTNAELHDNISPQMSEFLNELRLTNRHS